MTSQETREEVLSTAHGMFRAGAEREAVMERLYRGGFNEVEVHQLLADMNTAARRVTIPTDESAGDLVELQEVAQGMRQAGADRSAVVARLIAGGYEAAVAEAFVSQIDAAATAGVVSNRVE